MLDGKMSFVTDSLREHLQQREKTLELVEFFVRKAVEAEQSDLKSRVPDDGGYINFYRLQLESSAENNVNAIYAAAESPIELAFLNSLHLCFIKAAPLNVYFRQSAPDHLAFMEQHIEFYRAVDQRFDEFQRDRQGATVADFLRKAQAIYAETEGYAMPSELHNDLKNYLYFVRDFIHNYYHFTIQANLPTIKHDGRGMRPDLFIWVPTDQSLKIAVECDGYKYHSDPTSFTRDRQRDRILHSHGIEVLRFSGHEIHHGPQKAAGELFEQLQKLADVRCFGPDDKT